MGSRNGGDAQSSPRAGAGLQAAVCARPTPRAGRIRRRLSFLKSPPRSYNPAANSISAQGRPFFGSRHGRRPCVYKEANMPYFIRKGLGATILGWACWSSFVLGAEDEELPPPAAEAVQSAALAEETASTKSEPPRPNGKQPSSTAASNVADKERQTGQVMFGAGANSNADLPADDQPAADRNEPIIESAPGLFEANPEVLEFARK